jgi:hypothetical protein
MKAGRGRGLLVWATLSASSVVAAAAGPSGNVAPLPSIKSFFRNADVADVRLSPSGTWLAMIVGGEKTRKALAVVDVAGQKPPAIVALFSDADIRSFRWVDDERLIFNLIDVESGGGDQRFGPGLYSVHRDATEMRQLIKSRREFFRAAPGLSHHEALEWNHALLGVPNDGGHEVLIGQYVFSRRGELEAVNALRLDVDTGRTRSLAVGSPASSSSWLFDPKGEPRAVVAVHEGVAKTYWRAPGQDGWRLIATDPEQSRAFSPYYADGSGNLFVSTGSSRDGEELKRFDFASGKPEREAIVSTPGFDLDLRIVTSADGMAIDGQRMHGRPWERCAPTSIRAARPRSISIASRRAMGSTCRCG